jgi:hypothetical protein
MAEPLADPAFLLGAEHGLGRVERRGPVRVLPIAHRMIAAVLARVDDDELGQRPPRDRPVEP